MNNAKCNFNSINKITMIFSLFVLPVILIITMVYFLQLKHNKIKEEFGNTCSFQENNYVDTYNLRDCEIYLTSNISQCDMAKSSDPDNTCKYKLEGWKEFDISSNIDNLTTKYQKKVYNKLYTGDIINGDMVSKCFKPITGNNEIRYEYDMNTVVQKDCTGGGINNKNKFNNIDYASMKFINGGDNTQNFNNVIDSICSIYNNNASKLSIDNYSFYKLEINNQNKIISFSKVILNTTHKGFDTQNFKLNKISHIPSYGMSFVKRNGTSYTFKIFKKKVFKPKRVSVYKFKYNYLCTNSQILSFNKTELDLYIDKLFNVKSEITNELTLNDLEVPNGFFDEFVSNTNVNKRDLIFKKINNKIDEYKKDLNIKFNVLNTGISNELTSLKEENLRLYNIINPIISNPTFENVCTALNLTKGCYSKYSNISYKPEVKNITNRRDGYSNRPDILEIEITTNFRLKTFSIWIDGVKMLSNPPPVTLYYYNVKENEYIKINSKFYSYTRSRTEYIFTPNSNFPQVKKYKFIRYLSFVSLLSIRWTEELGSETPEQLALNDKYYDNADTNYKHTLSNYPSYKLDTNMGFTVNSNNKFTYNLYSYIYVQPGYYKFTGLLIGGNIILSGDLFIRNKRNELCKLSSITTNIAGNSVSNYKCQKASSYIHFDRSGFYQIFFKSYGFNLTNGNIGLSFRINCEYANKIPISRIHIDSLTPANMRYTDIIEGSLISFTRELNYNTWMFSNMQTIDAQNYNIFLEIFNNMYNITPRSNTSATFNNFNKYIKEINGIAQIEAKIKQKEDKKIALSSHYNILRGIIPNTTNFTYEGVVSSVDANLQSMNNLYDAISRINYSSLNNIPDVPTLNTNLTIDKIFKYDPLNLSLLKTVEKFNKDDLTPSGSIPINAKKSIYIKVFDL